MKLININASPENSVTPGWHPTFPTAKKKQQGIRRRTYHTRVEYLPHWFRLKFGPLIICFSFPNDFNYSLLYCMLCEGTVLFATEFSAPSTRSDESRCSVKWSEGKVAQSCPTLCNPMDYTVHGILQAKILKWVAFPFSRGSSQPRDQTQVSCIEGRFFTSWATREAQEYWSG